MTRPCARILAAVCVWLFALATAAPAEEKFQKFSSTDGRFTVEMPGKAAVSSTKSSEGVTMNFAIVKSLIEQYEVMYFDAPEQLIKNSEPQKLFKAFTDSEYPNMKLEKEKVIAFGTDKWPGLEYRVETVVKTDNGGMVPVFKRDRLILAGNRFYIVQYRAVVNKNLLDSKEADRFFDSFAITK
jgi:hypothetical protein